MTGTGASFGAWEAVTSLGESAAETALLLRAGLCNVAPSRFIDAKGQRVMFCSAPAIAPDLVGIDRASALAHFALTRLGERIGAADRGVLLLAVADHYGAGENTFARSKSGAAFLERLRSAMSFVRRVEIELFPFGRAAGAVALQRALELVGDDALVIWGGVDTM